MKKKKADGITKVEINPNRINWNDHQTPKSNPKYKQSGMYATKK